MRFTSKLVGFAAVATAATAIALPNADPIPDAAVVRLENRDEGCRLVQFGMCSGDENVLYVPDFHACYHTVQGACPNTPWNVRKVLYPLASDWGDECMWIENGRCPGDDNVKWVTSLGLCAHIRRGECTDNDSRDWVKIGEPYRGPW